MDTQSVEFRPPYMSFQTFWSFIEELASKPLPPRVDRSLMTSKSGSDQANLISALWAFGLTDEGGNVQDELTLLVGTPPEDRKAAFGELVRKFYTGPLRVSAENGTQADLNKVFTDDYEGMSSPETRRKAITFFLHSARNAEIPLSPHFPATRSGSGAPGAPKAKRTPAKRKQHNDDKGDAGSQLPPPPGASSLTTQTVILKSGGTVTLGYNMSLFDLDDDDQEFVLDLVRKVKNYKGSRPNKKADTSTTEGGDDA